MSHRSLRNPASGPSGSRKVTPSPADQSAPTRTDTDGSKRPGNDRCLLDDILDHPNLPSPPAVALEIVELASDPDTDIREIVNVLKVDPAICAKLLKTVNSCFFGLRKPVATIERAVSVVGFNPLRSLVLGMAIPSLHGRLGADGGLRSFWRESVGGAMMARELAVRVRYPQVEEIFLAGLLRDLGTTLLRERFGAAYDPVWCVSHERWTEMWGKTQCDWERNALTLDHAELSAALLTRWHLPVEIVQMVRHHHDPEAAAGMAPLVRQGAAILDFCSQMARIDNVAEDPESLRGLIRLASDHGMTVADIEQFLNVVSPKIEEFAEILDIEIASCAHFAEVLAAGCAELARLSVELSLGHTSSHGDSSPADTRCEDDEPAPDAEAADKRTEAQLAEYSLDFLERLGEPGFEVHIRQYQVKKVLGRGGMGVVLKAFEPGLDRVVALKMISPQLAIQRRVRERFADEARAAASIMHENVVTVFTVGKYRGVSFLVMEYVDGFSIQDHFKARRRFHAREIARIGEELALGLAAAHRLGVIHRDVKPGNVLLRREDERALLTDFGLACVIREEAEDDSTRSVWGTPEYMSPEQSRGESVRFATDLYSLGGTLFALCTNTHPLPWVVRQQTPDYSIATAIRQANAEIPNVLTQAVVKLMSPDPFDRYRSAEETAKVFRAIGRHLQ